ncbi:MAG: hypothetical protein K5979_13585 [Ruminococcus sp.]|nr:hypothetical protein [Ruminococcus sp.]
MKYEKLKDSAENIKMPDELKTRILDRCSDIAANEKRSGIDHNSDHVSGVERVSSRPVRRTFAAAAACAVLAAGVGTALHFMPKTSHNAPASNMSDTLNDNILEALSDLLDRDFTGTNDEEFSDEQRNEIKNILTEYEWTEISEEQYNSNGIPNTVFTLHADENDDTWTLMLSEDNLAKFSYMPIENVNKSKPAVCTYYRVNSAEIVQRINDMLASAENDAPRPLADIAERQYKEISWSATEALPEEKRVALDEIISNTTFTYNPDCTKVYSFPAYFFTDAEYRDAQSHLEDSADLVYLYNTGVAEVHEAGNTYFYDYDYDTLSRQIDELLFSDRIFTGKDLVCADMLNEDISFHGGKSFEDLQISDESKAKIWEYLSTAKFRKVADSESSLAYISADLKDVYDHDIGFENYEINRYYDYNHGWSLHFYSCGYLEVADAVNGNGDFTYYIYDPAALDSALRDAIPELSSSYPPFGMLYKMGEIKVNGNVIDEQFKKKLSNVFFGYNYINEVTNDDFRSETPVYTIETDINDRTLTIRTYNDGTVEYNDENGVIHSYDRIGSPETSMEGMINTEIVWAIDPELY